MFWRSGIDPRHEPHKVLIHKGELEDKARSRIVPYKIYYPVSHGLESLPVVIWSHGLGGSRDGAAFLTRWLAAQGYIVVNVQHVGTDSSIWEGKPGHPWDVIRATPISRQMSLDRFRDVPFLLDCLPQIGREKAELGNYMNMDRMGMSGHSFGAITTQVMAGMKFPDENNELARMKEDRFSAGILYSFGVLSHLVDGAQEDIYGSMDIPLFFMTGTDDRNPLSNAGYEHRMPAYEQAGSPEKHLLILEDGDHMVFAGSRGKLGENPNRDIQETIIKVTSLAFWDAHLKSDKAAREWLTAGGIHPYLEGHAQYGYETQ